MTTLIGRLTRDAEVKQLFDEKTVVNFSLALNDYYREKTGGQRKQLTTFVRCAYWKGAAVARLLTKGTLVQLTGRLSTETFVGYSGEVKASLKCRVSQLIIYGHGKSSEENRAANTNAPFKPATENSPF